MSESALPGAESGRLEKMLEDLHHPTSSVTIALVGKYVALHDAYLSVAEALKHGGIANRTQVNIRWIDAEELTPENLEEYLHDVDGILVPGGFGQRGTEGKILAIGYARRNKIPYLGLCLGMQLAIVEFARNVAGLSKAASIELDPETPGSGHRTDAGTKRDYQSWRYFKTGRISLCPATGNTGP